MKDTATAYLEQLESLAAATSGPLLRAEAGYARPMVADDDKAEALCQTALERDLTNWLRRWGRISSKQQELPNRVTPRRWRQP
jgi:hypothetical protein